MNQQERDELRDKHSLHVYEDRMTGKATLACDVCGDGYPCDVIKVLDAWETVANTNPNSVSQSDQVAFGRTDGLVSPAQTDTCTHHGMDSGGTDYYGTSNPPQEADWNFAYCPKCGEKL